MAAMQKRQRVYAVRFIILLSNAVHFCCCNDLPGSCIGAGYTTCCNSEEDTEFCAGDSESCFCDPSCREFNDCCSDLDEICPRKDLFYPLAIFSSNVTYHSATLQWATAHVDSSFNHTFIISYTNASTNSLSFNSTKVIKIQYGPIGDLYSAVLPGLTPNATFQTNVISSSLFYREKIFEGPTITTLSYPSLANTKAKMFNMTTVELSWDHVKLPANVKVLEYLVYFRRHNEQIKKDDEDGGKIHRLSFLPKSDSSLVTVHASHAWYNFSMAAIIEDIDGTVFETSKSLSIAVFVPSWQLFQLKGSSTLACSGWNVEIEAAVTTVFQDGIVSAIRSKCNCHFPLAHIADASLLCHESANVINSISTVNRSYVTFRAKLLSVEGHTSEDLLEFLDTWLASSPLLSTQQATNSSLNIKLTPHCPLRLNRKSEPLCVSGINKESWVVIPSAQEVEMNATEPLTTCISLPILVASLVAELLLLLVVFLVGTVVTLLITSRRDKKRRPSEVSFPPARELRNVGGRRLAPSNTYVTTPSVRAGECEDSTDAITGEDGQLRSLSSSGTVTGTNQSDSVISSRTTKQSLSVDSEQCQATADQQR